MAFRISGASQFGVFWFVEKLQVIGQMIGMKFFLGDQGRELSETSSKWIEKGKVHKLLTGSALFCFSKLKQNSLFIGGPS